MFEIPIALHNRGIKMQNAMTTRSTAIKKKKFYHLCYPRSYGLYFPET